MPESNPETHFSFLLDILSDESMGCGEQAEPGPCWAELLSDSLPSGGACMGDGNGNTVRNAFGNEFLMSPQPALVLPSRHLLILPLHLPADAHQQQRATREMLPDVPWGQPH